MDLPRMIESSNDLMSTTGDLLTFQRALLEGALFGDLGTVALLTERRNRLRNIVVIRYGLGTMIYRVARLAAPGRRPVTLVGHSGGTGSWLFHCPELDVHLAGTVDQTKGQAVPSPLMVRLLRDGGPRPGSDAIRVVRARRSGRPALGPSGRLLHRGSRLLALRSSRLTVTSTSTAMARPPSERAVLWLEGLLAVGAFGGAAGLITGAVDLGAATADLPFGSVIFAGLALLVVNGLLPTGVMIAALSGHPRAPLGHVLVGVALVAWISLQVAFLGWPPHWLQLTYFAYGWTIVVLAVVAQRSLPAIEQRELLTR